MAIIEQTVEIKCPVDKVFTYVADANSWPKWQLSMMESKQTSPGEIGVGTTFAGASKLMGLRIAWTSNLREYEVNKIFGESVTLLHTLFELTLTFDPVEEGTKLTWVYDIKARGFLKLFTPILVWLSRRDLKSCLSTLKSTLESQTHQ